MSSDQIGAVIFGAGAVVLVCLAIALIAGYLISHHVLYAALAILAAGFGLALGYETFALWTDSMPTISRITARAFVADPAVWLLILMVVMFIGGNLVVDLRVMTRLRGWLVAASVGALAVGAVIAIQTNWLP